jgi:hypothetical protein
MNSARDGASASESFGLVGKFQPTSADADVTSDEKTPRVSRL